MIHRNKRVAHPDTAVVGMGRTGCSIVRFLERQHIDCAAFDEHLKRLPEDVHADFHAGSLRARALHDYTRVLVSPGVDWRHPALANARANGAEVIGDLDLFSAQFDGDLIAVTGTNGKSTVVHLLGLMLEILPGGAELGGNIGQPMLDMLQDDAAPARAVLELSSFQLERCGGVHPKWAALLNVQPDHADKHDDFHAYEAAKLKLFEQQSEGDTAMLPLDKRWHRLANELAERGVRVQRFGFVENEAETEAGLKLEPHSDADGSDGSLFWTDADGTHRIPVPDLRVRGVHQQLNLAVAAQAAADFGVSASVITESLTVFPGLAHRLQYIGHRTGRAWYDDSKATNPQAACAAIESFEHVIWICGGLTKGLDLMPLLDAVKQHVAHAYIIGKQTKVYQHLLAQAGIPHQVVGDLHKAVALAAENRMPLPVLLSPAAASQDQFSDYAERGECFVAAVATLERAA